MKSQEKITKEMNYILGNQDSIQAQITQVESGIAQTEVHSTVVLIILSVFMRHLLQLRVETKRDEVAGFYLDPGQEWFCQCPMFFPFPKYY